MRVLLVDQWRSHRPGDTINVGRYTGLWLLLLGQARAGSAPVAPPVEEDRGFTVADVRKYAAKNNVSPRMAKRALAAQRRGNPLVNAEPSAPDQKEA